MENQRRPPSDAQRPLGGGPGRRIDLHRNRHHLRGDALRIRSGKRQYNSGGLRLAAGTALRQVRENPLRRRILRRGDELRHHSSIRCRVRHVRRVRLERREGFAEIPADMVRSHPHGLRRFRDRFQTGGRDRLRAGGERPYSPNRRGFPAPRPERPQIPRPPRKQQNSKRPRLCGRGGSHDPRNLEHWETIYRINKY